MATFGTIEVYEQMAKLLNDDEQWAELGKPISYSMVYAYREPVDRVFYVRFEEGQVTDVRELASAEAEPADFVLTADPDVWRGVLEKRIKPAMALTTGKIKIKGNLATLMKHMKAFSHVLDVMTEVELV